MLKMNFCRRKFLKSGVASLVFGAAGRPTLFAVPAGWKPSRKPRLVFGVMSDTHMRVHYDGVNFYRHYDVCMDDTAVKAVLKYFKDENVDAVAHCGDLTDRGMTRTMELYKKAWDEVFTGGTQPASLYATGNHDVEEGFDYWAKGIAHSEDPEVYNKIRLGPNLKSAMERIWGEPYEDVWHKAVKGYHFFGMGWGLNPDDQSPVYHGNLYHDSPMEGKGCSRFIHKGLWMAELVRREREAGRLDPSKPFFTIYHCNINRYDRRRAIINTHLASALGVSPGTYCNGLGFFGHGHRSNADWHFFWDNKAVFPAIECASLAYWKDRGGEGKDPLFAKGFGDGTAEGIDNGTHALLVRVYDDVLVLHRIWVTVKPKVELASLGPDIVMPLAGFTPGNHPLQFDNLVKVIGEPKFRRDAKLEAVLEEDALKVRIPKADGNNQTRVYGYNIVVAGKDGTVKVKKSIYANGYSMGEGHEPDNGVTTVSFPKAELPAGDMLTIAVRPCSSLGTKGQAIAMSFSVKSGISQMIKRTS